MKDVWGNQMTSERIQEARGRAFGGMITAPRSAREVGNPCARSRLDDGAFYLPEGACDQEVCCYCGVSRGLHWAPRGR